MWRALASSDLPKFKSRVAELKLTAQFTVYSFELGHLGEAGVDSVLIQTSLLFKYENHVVIVVISLHLHIKEH